MNSCPYYDVSDEVYGRLIAMIETMNERHEHFVSDMREFGLSHETNLSLPSPNLIVSMMIVSRPISSGRRVKYGLSVFRV